MSKQHKRTKLPVGRAWNPQPPAVASTDGRLTASNGSKPRLPRAYHCYLRPNPPPLTGPTGAHRCCQKHAGTHRTGTTKRQSRP